MAQITVRYFAAAAEAAGVDEEPWDLGVSPTIGELRAGLARRYGAAMERVLRAGSFLVDGEVRRDEGALRGSVVDVLPPFAGG
ncbi:MoaD/ThiS family protein [Leucobacter sp. CSA1]|uniref:MoaD/ThiS family protein n=1 Tax=Leucobacter chromiisoli TaxID=2796471 RepID=A0A934Q4V7_9MICO|nr:MoaD/ThiS family protein [Leucobacter chromiisoli]MBK0417611.1 MoaD/ThiS family protein [Leucobacter chromiisoli]